TYDHRNMKTRLPVRSALFKHVTGGLVVRWETTGEYLLLYVFIFYLFPWSGEVENSAGGTARANAAANPKEKCHICTSGCSFCYSTLNKEQLI
ncbi:hypothetical protein DM02DRAFT_527161, partial [Periconia macrospinosa]